MEPFEEGERRREEIIQAAVQAADHEILSRFDGSTEELEYLTMYVTLRFAQKVAAMQQGALLKKTLFERFNEKTPKAGL